MKLFNGKYQDERILVEQCLEGNESAWDMLIECYTPLIYAIAAWPQWRFSKEDIEDLCEDVLVKLIEGALAGFQFRSSLKNYIALIAKHACYDRSSRLHFEKSNILSLEKSGMSGRPLEEVITFNSDIEDQSLINEAVCEIRKAISRLEEQCHKIIILRYQREMTYSQISRSLKIPIGTVGTLVSRCTDKIVESMGVFLGD